MGKFEKDGRVAFIMERTMCNLRFVKEQCGEKGPYEVTQLVNSFMGALAHPWEDLGSISLLELKQLKISAAIAQGLRVIEPTAESPKKSYPNYGQMLRVVRNAFAHGNLTFDDDGRDITAVTMCSKYKDDDRIVHVEWIGRATIGDLEAFLWAFYDLANGDLPIDQTHEPIFAMAAD